MTDRPIDPTQYDLQQMRARSEHIRKNIAAIEAGLAGERKKLKENDFYIREIERAYNLKHPPTSGPHKCNSICRCGTGINLDKNGRIIKDA
jgi:hypothetical protein